ncbi:hypothetical protein ACQKG5_14295 [Serratia bockelmannii]
MHADHEQNCSTSTACCTAG